MDAWQQFGFTRPPFGPTPDAEFFYDAPAHAEALATLQYALLANKGSCVVVGESGYGKTLLARIVAASTGAKAPVFWVYGCGQPDNATKVSVYPPGRFGRPDGAPGVAESTLSAETHAARFLPDPPLLVVDCADELPPHGWCDVLAWLSNEIRCPRPINAFFFGLPRLLEMLAAPELARLERHIFRVCLLEPLSPELTKEYIHARCAAAKGEPRYIFSDAVIAQIDQLAQGNPARINRLCDNALLEAYGEGRDYVAMSDVDGSFRTTLIGRLQEYVALPAPSSTPYARPALPPVHVRTPHPAGAVVLNAPSPAYEPASDALTVRSEDFSEIEMRLQHFEERLSDALHVVRQPYGRQGGSAADMPVLEDRLPAVAGAGHFSARPVLIEA